MERVHDTRPPIALLLTDTHCGKETCQEFIRNWQEAVDLCKVNAIAKILFAGDLVLSRAAQTLDVLLAIHDVLALCAQSGIEVVMINGNHCKVDQEAERGYCDVFDSFPNVRVVNTWAVVPVAPALSVGMISYFPEQGSFIPRLEALQTHMDSQQIPCKLLILHQGIRGGLAQATDDELPAKVFSRWEKVLVGHYHNRNSIEPNIEYVGSSRQHNFGEDEMKGYTLIYPDAGTEFIQNKANIRYKVIDIPVEKIGIGLIDQLSEIRATGCARVKVRIHGAAESMSNIDKTALLDAGATKVELQIEETTTSEAKATSLFERFDRARIRETYETFCIEKQFEEVKLGLKYLSKIDLSCGN